MAQDPRFVVVTEEEQEALDDGDLPTVSLSSLKYSFREDDDDVYPRETPHLYKK